MDLDATQEFGWHKLIWTLVNSQIGYISGKNMCFQYVFSLTRLKLSFPIFHFNIRFLSQYVDIMSRSMLSHSMSQYV